MHDLTDRERAMLQRCRTKDVVLDLRRPINGRAVIWYDEGWRVMFESPRGTRTSELATDADYVSKLIEAAITISCNDSNPLVTGDSQVIYGP